MNKRIISSGVLLVVLLSLTSCSKEKEKELTPFMIQRVLFYEGADAEGVLAYYLWDGPNGINDYGFPKEAGINLPHKKSAGDQLIVYFDGEFDIYCQLTFPGSCRMVGKIDSYEYRETDIKRCLVSDLLTDKYVLSPRYAIDYRDNDIYVVTDEKGHYVPIDEYEEDYLYISIDLEKTDVYIASHTDDSEEPPIFVSALYSYNPRL